MDDTAREIVKRNIAKYLKNGCQGEQNRITRWELFKMIAKSTSIVVEDRLQREILSELRTEPRGKWIVTTLKGGVFWAVSKDELSRALIPDWNRVKHTAERLRAQAKLCELHIPDMQERLF